MAPSSKYRVHVQSNTAERRYSYHDHELEILLVYGAPDKNTPKGCQGSALLVLSTRKKSALSASLVVSDETYQDFLRALGQGINRKNTRVAKWKTQMTKQNKEESITVSLAEELDSKSFMTFPIPLWERVAKDLEQAFGREGSALRDYKKARRLYESLARAYKFNLSPMQRAPLRESLFAPRP